MSHEPPSLRDVEEPRLHAFVELRFLAATVDGEFSGDERQQFQSSVESLTDRKIAGTTLDKLMARIEQDHAGEGRAARISHVKEALPTPELRRIGLEMAV